MNYKKGYKAFNKGLVCRGHKFKVGETYEIKGDLSLCSNGFHFCKDLVLTLEYYPDFDNNDYCEVEALGETEYEQPTGHKACTARIKILRKITKKELKKLVDGNWNSGDWNSGNSNSGNWNSGNRNSGDGNSGNWNSGDWNSGNRNSGFFNTDTPSEILAFNKLCDRKKWEESNKPGFLFFDTSEDYKESFQKSFKDLTIIERETQVKQLKALPNFDKDIFYEISGIKID